MSRGRYLSPSAQRGAGLIEVSISLLLIAIGTLGLGSLQMSSKQMGYEAIQRGEAAALAMDLLERLRSNRVALAGYATAGVGEGSGSQSPVPLADCNVSTCSPAELNAWDMWQWEQALDGVSTSGQAGGLVRPTACVTVSGRQVTVEIAWQGFRPVSTPSQQFTCGAGHYGDDDLDRQSLRMISWISEE